MATMSVRFTGLCAFVPNTTAGRRVVLVNARDHVHPPMEPHIPAILVDLANWNIGGRQISFNFNGTMAGFGGPNMVAYELDDETLSISTSGTLNADMTTLLAPCPTFGQGGDAESLRWMARMQTVGAGTMLRTAYEGTSTDVLARMDIDAGDSLRTMIHAFHNEGNQRIAKWENRSGGSTVGTPRALAEVIQWSFQIGASVTIGSSKGGSDINLTPIGPTGVVWLVNQPKLDITTFRGTPRRQPDTHFEHYYRLAFNPSTIFTPHPLGPDQDCDPIPGGGASNPRCPVSFFDSVQP